jgi:phage terminase small subunit
MSEPVGRRLTAKQRAFVEAYLTNGRNAAAAYRSAYDTSASPARVAEDAQDLLKHPLISPIIEESDKKRDEVTRRVIEQTSITAEEIISRLIHMARADLRDVMDWTGGRPVLKSSADLTPEQAYAISEIAETQNGLRIKLTDKRAVLMDIAKLMGLLVEKQQQLGPDGKPIDPRQVFTVVVKG